MTSNSKLHDGGMEGLEPQTGSQDIAAQAGSAHTEVDSSVPRVDTIEVFLDKLEKDFDIVALKNQPSAIVAPPIRFLSAIIDANLRGDGIKHLLDKKGQIDPEKLLAKLKTVFGHIIVTIQNAQYNHFFPESGSIEDPKPRAIIIEKYQTAFSFIASAHGIQDKFIEYLGILGVVPSADASKSQLGTPGRKRLSTKPYMGPGVADDEVKPSSRSNIPVRTEELSPFKKRVRTVTIPGIQLQDLLQEALRAQPRAETPGVVQPSANQDEEIDREIEQAIGAMIRTSMLPPALKNDEGKSLGHLDSDTEALRITATHEFKETFSAEYLALFPVPATSEIKTYNDLVLTAFRAAYKKIRKKKTKQKSAHRYFMDRNLIASEDRAPLLKKHSFHTVEDQAMEAFEGKLKPMLERMQNGQGISKMLISIDFSKFSAALADSADRSADKNIISYILSCSTNELDEVVACLSDEMVAGFSEDILRKYPGSPFSWLLYFYQDDKPELKTRIYELFYDTIYNYCTALRYGYEEAPEEVAQVAEGARFNFDEIMGSMELPPSSVAPPSLEDLYGPVDEGTGDDSAVAEAAPALADSQLNASDDATIETTITDDPALLDLENYLALSDEDRAAIRKILGHEYNDGDAGTDAVVEFKETGEAVGPIIAKILSPTPQAPEPKDKVIIAEGHGATVEKSGKGLQLPELNEEHEKDLRSEGFVRVGVWLIELDDRTHKNIYTYTPTGQVFFPVRPAAGQRPSSAPPPAMTTAAAAPASAMPATRREPVRPLAQTIPDSPPLSRTLPLVTPQKEMEVPLVRYGHEKLPEPTPPPVRVMKGTQVIDAPPPSTLRAGQQLSNVRKMGSAYQNVPVVEINPLDHVLEVATDRPTKPEIVLKAPVGDKEYLRTKSNPPPKKSSRWGLIAGVALGALSTVGGLGAYKYFQSNKTDAVQLDAKQKADTEAKATGSAKPAETAKPAQAPIETKKTVANESAPKVAEVLGSSSYGLGSANGTNTFTGKAAIFEGGVDATPFASKVRTAAWIENQQKAAASILKIYDIAKDHFDAGTSELISKNEKILRDIAALTDFTPANFRKTFEGKYSQAELNDGYNLLLGYERIEDFTGNDPSKLEGTSATIKLTMGAKSHDLTARFAKAIDFRAADAAPVTPGAPAQDLNPGVDQKDDGKTGFNDVHSIDVDLSDFNEIHASTSSRINTGDTGASKVSKKEKLGPLELDFNELEMAVIDKGWDDVPAGVASKKEKLAKLELDFSEFEAPSLDQRISAVKASRRDALLTRGEVFIPPISDDMDGSVMLAIKNGFLKECTTISSQNKVEAILSRLRLRDMVEYEATENGTFGKLNEEKLAELNAAAMLEEAKTEQDKLLEEIETEGWDAEPASVAKVSAVTKSRIISIGGDALSRAA